MLVAKTGERVLNQENEKLSPVSLVSSLFQGHFCAKISGSWWLHNFGKSQKKRRLITWRVLHIKIPSSVHEWRVSAVMQRCKISFLPLICSRRSLLMCLSSFHIFRHRCRGQTKVMTRIKYLPVSKKENASLFFCGKGIMSYFLSFPRKPSSKGLHFSLPPFEHMFSTLHCWNSFP